MYVPIQPAQQSPRSRELATRLRGAIADFTRANPKLTRAEIDAALHAVRESEGGDPRTRRQAGLVAAAIAVTIAGLGGVIGNANAHGQSMLLPVMGVVVVAVVLGALLFVRWRDR